MVAPSLVSSFKKNFYGVQNGSGGRVWVSRNTTNATEVRTLVRHLQSQGATDIKILTGTHGTTAGHFSAEYRFFLEDLASFANDPGVQVIEAVSSSGAPFVLTGIINGPGEIVAAYCYSECSYAVIQAFSSP